MRLDCYCNSAVIVRDDYILKDSGDESTTFL